MPVDKSDAERPEEKLYEFMVQNKGVAFTKQELEEECGVKTLGSMHTYTSFKPYKWVNVYYDGVRHYTVKFNYFAVSMGLLSGMVLVFFVWLLLTNPSAFYTCGL